MNKQILVSLAATLLLIGCAHQNHGDRHHQDNGLVSTVVKYPFKMAEYVIWSPFHPIESTRMAIETTAEIPIKVLDATSEAHALNMRLLFGHGEQHDDHGEQHHDDRNDRNADGSQRPRLDVYGNDRDRNDRDRNDRDRNARLAP